VIRDVARRGTERLDCILEPRDRGHGADGQAGTVAIDSRQPRVAEHQDARRPQAPVVDLGHQDRAAAEDGDAGTVSERLDRLVPGRRDDELSCFKRCRRHSPLLFEGNN
jgi:hypothetical protein